MRKYWTDDEISFLEEKTGVMKITTIAEKLGRSVSSVELKMKRLGISDTKLQTGMLTLNELAGIINVDNHTVYRWSKKHGLKVLKKITSKKQYYHLVDINDFWKWAEKNKEKINFSKIEPFSLCPEPHWFDEERKKDYQSIPKRQAAKWTEYEDKRLIDLVNGNYTQMEIADLLNRSEHAIQRRLSRLREMRKLPKNKIILRWSDEELNTLLKLEKQGLSDKQIAYELGREPYHISDKRRCLRIKGLYHGHKKGLVEV